MRRLREEVRSSDALHAEAGALVASERPITKDEVRRRRVLAAIEARTARRRPMRGMALALAASLLIALVGVAGAAIGRWIERRHPARPMVAPSAPMTPAPTPVPTPTSNQTPAAAATPTAAVAPHAAVEPARPAKHPEHRTAQPIRSPAPAMSLSPPPTSAPPPVEVPPTEATSPTSPRATNEPTAEAVFAATRALRQDHKPRRAAKLLDSYMAKSPTGALAEEALALDIEAHLAIGDTESARLGRLYLDRFPTGRFRALAERAARSER